MSRDSGRRRSRAREPGSRAWPTVALLLSLVAVLGSTWLHVRLESSIPAAGDVLSAPPELFVLEFSGGVDESLSSATLAYPSDDSVPLTLRSAPGDAATLHADVPRLETGAHVLRWRTVSLDGHPVGGEIPFSVAAEATPSIGADSGTEVHPVAEAAPSSSNGGETAYAPGASVGTLSALLGGLGMACLLAFAGLLWHAGATSLFDEPSIRKPTTALGWTAFGLFAIGIGWWLRQVGVPGDGLAGLWKGLASRTGAVAGLRIVLLVGALAAAQRWRRGAAVLAVGALLVGSLAGHAAVFDPWVTIPANAVHLGAAAMWMGGLMLIVLLPASWAGGPDGSPDPRLLTVATSVSSSALLAVMLVLASGVIQSLLFVGDFAAYIGTPYGRLVLLKWLGLAILIGFGAWHRFRVLPDLVTGGAGEDVNLKRSVKLETAVMLLVIMAAAWLARTSPPVSY